MLFHPTKHFQNSDFKGQINFENIKSCLKAGAVPSLLLQSSEIQTENSLPENASIYNAIVKHSMIFSVGSK